MADRGKAAHVEPDLFARAQQSAQVLCRCVRDKARPDETVRQQIGQPVGIADVSLAAGHILDV